MHVGQSPTYNSVPEQEIGGNPLDIGCPPRPLMAEFNCGEPSAYRVEQQKYPNPDQINHGKAESPPGGKVAEGDRGGTGLIRHEKDAYQRQPMDGVQMKEIEKQRDAAENNEETRQR